MRWGAFVALATLTLCCSPAIAAHRPAADTTRDALATTLALVTAGGGSGDYRTTTLIGVLAGSDADTEIAKLTRHFGAPAVKTFILTFDRVIVHALQLIRRNGVVLPATPWPDPTDGRALSAALYRAGVDPSRGTYDADVMFDHLVLHALRVVIMKDVGAKYGAQNVATFHAVLGVLMEDLHEAYAL